MIYEMEENALPLPFKIAYSLFFVSSCLCGSILVFQFNKRLIRSFRW